jgi:chlorobactene glucosyltransferase
MINHQLGIIYFLAALLVIAGSNLILLRKLENPRRNNIKSPNQNLPKVSILVPARNEENTIKNCIESLLAQDYPDYEILVLDDHSQDCTREILDLLSSQSDRLKILSGSDLPDGWLGKHWACHQLAESASGEILLFTDADTIHHPQTLRESFSALVSNQYEFLTAMPYQIVRTWGERLLVPIMYWAFFSFLPLVLAFYTPLSIFSIAIGQFMLFRRAAYERIGGYQAIRDHTADDLAFARLVKRHRLHWGCYDAGNRIHCRMYRNFGEAFQGFRKNFFAIFDFRILPYLFIWIWLGIVFLEPVLLLLLGRPLWRISDQSLYLAAGSILLSAVLWALVTWRFRFPFTTILFYPVTVIFCLVIAASSLVFNLRGEATWKGRQIARPKVTLF